MQDCNDALWRVRIQRDQLRAERAGLQVELDQYQRTLDDMQHNRQTLETSNRELRTRVRTLGTELAERNAAATVQSPESDPDNRVSDDTDDSGSLDTEILLLRADIVALRAKLAAVSAELKRQRQRSLNQAQFRSQVAQCATDKERLAKFGTDFDVNSPLYRVLLKVANSVDNAGPQPTAAEQALLGRFMETLAQRKFAMAVARLDDNPRAKLEPLLDQWDAKEDECTFFSVDISLPLPGGDTCHNACFVFFSFFDRWLTRNPHHSRQHFPSKKSGNETSPGRVGRSQAAVSGPQPLGMQ